MANKNKWMQDIGDGSLSKALSIPEEKNIPMSLLSKIISTEIGETVTNPTSTGKKKIKVTRLLKQRAVAARNMKKA